MYLQVKSLKFFHYFSFKKGTQRSFRGMIVLDSVLGPMAYTVIVMFFFCFFFFVVDNANHES